MLTDESFLDGDDVKIQIHEYGYATLETHVNASTGEVVMYVVGDDALVPVITVINDNPVHVVESIRRERPNLSSAEIDALVAALAQEPNAKLGDMGMKV